MAETFGRVLMVGATGMLAAVARHLAPRSEKLVLAARAPAALAAQIGATPARLDWTDKASAAPVLEQEFDLVVSWLHRDGLWLTAPLEETLLPGGRSIRVHNSRSVDRAVRDRLDPAPRGDISRQIAVLAWDQHRGSRRWLTDEKIAAGVIELIQSPQTPLLIVGEYLHD